MIFQLLKQLQTDVWFCFDGFCYGFEFLIHECTKDSMHLVLKPEYRKHYDVLLKQTPCLLKHSCSELQTELRIYFPKKFAKILNCGHRIVLVTKKKPALIKDHLNEIEMRFTDLQGRSKKHSENWEHITSYEFKSEFDNF